MTENAATAQREATRHLARGDIEAALARLEGAFRLASASPEAREAPDLAFNLAAIHHNAGRQDLALGFFKRALILAPGFLKAFGHATTSTAQRRGPGPALKLARRLARLAPLSPQVRALATQYTYELGDHAAVPALARAALVLEPGAAGLYRLMGLSASRLQRIEAATTALQRACALQPNWADARLALAGATFAQRDFEGCLAEASHALALGGDRAEATFLQARAALALNRVEDADTFFAIAVAEEPARALDARIARLTLSRADFTHYHAY